MSWLKSGAKSGIKYRRGGGKLNLKRANLYSTVLQPTGLIKQVENRLLPYLKNTENRYRKKIPIYRYFFEIVFCLIHRCLRSKSSLFNKRNDILHLATPTYEQTRFRSRSNLNLRIFPRS